MRTGWPLASTTGSVGLSTFKVRTRSTPLRAPGTRPHPAFETLAAELLAELGKIDEALATYRAALQSSPGHRGLTYGYLTLLLNTGHAPEVVAFLDERLRTRQADAKLYELQARAFGATGRRLSQHRAQAEAYYRRGNLAAAVGQLEIAVKLAPQDANIHYQLGQAYQRIGRTELAEREFETFRRLKDRNRGGAQ